MTQDVNSARKWEADYEHQTDGWDLGGPTPIFKRLLLSRLLTPGRIIVLGTFFARLRKPDGDSLLFAGHLPTRFAACSPFSVVHRFFHILRCTLAILCHNAPFLTVLGLEMSL